MAFTTFGLSPAILQGVKAIGYVQPTPIQIRTIPLVMQGRDVIGSAQTGTGKTAAFALPILSLLDHHEQKSRCLVLEPTRELAAQVETAIHDFARFTNLHTAVLYGGVGYGKQMDALGGGADIIVATPGRLLDHMERGTCRLDAVKFLVLDEADRMLDMGFLPDVRRIVLKGVRLQVCSEAARHSRQRGAIQRTSQEHDASADQFSTGRGFELVKHACNRVCHPERSEGSWCVSAAATAMQAGTKIPRCARDDSRHSDVYALDFAAGFRYLLPFQLIH